MKQFPNNRSLYTQTPIFFVINQVFPWPVFHFWIISPFTVGTLRKTPFAPLDNTFAPKKSDICAINVCPFAPLNLDLNLNDPIGSNNSTNSRHVMSANHSTYGKFFSHIFGNMEMLGTEDIMSSHLRLKIKIYILYILSGRRYQWHHE